MRYFEYILYNGYRFSLILSMIIFALVCIGNSDADSVRIFMSTTTFSLYVLPCIMLSLSNLLKGVSQNATILRYGRKKIDNFSTSIVWINSVLYFLLLLFYSVLTFKRNQIETIWYWICLFFQILHMCYLFDFLHMLSKQIYAFLIILVIGFVEFANAFAPAGIDFSNPLLWNYSLFYGNGNAHLGDTIKSIVLIIVISYTKRFILTERKDFLND